jgi:hypothetical protein
MKIEFFYRQGGINMATRKNLFFIIIILLSGNLLFPAALVIPMPGLVYPDELQVSGNRMYIGEFPYVWIFSNDDFRLLKKIGRKGEGPKEFTQYLVPIANKDKLIVSSQGKVTFFTREGEYISEKKINIGGASFKPLGNFYGVYAYAREDKTDYRTIDVYDNTFKKIKELYRYRLWLQQRGPKKGAYVIDSFRFRFKVLEHNLVWTDMKDFIVYIWDSKTDRVKAIKQEYEPVKITEDDIKSFHRVLNKPHSRKFYLQIKPNIKFPTYFPPTKGLAVADNKIYVYTYKQKGELTEFYIFNMAGELVKKTYLNLKGGVTPEQYPFCFGNDKLYQLVESEDGEDWELQITKIQ